MDDYLILDTETTGLSGKDEVIELGIIDMDGNTIYHSLFNPSCPIGASAMNVHGITLEEVKDAPEFSEEWDKIKGVLEGKKVLIYNAKFDFRMLNQTARIYKCKEVLKRENVHCVMQGYAKYRGEKNPKTGGYRWFKLEQALQHEGECIVQSHRTIGDCLMTLKLVNKVGRNWW